MKRDYFSIHAHSEYSNLKVIDSTNRFSRMMDYAWDIGLSGIAMTDHDCISGAIKYIKTFKKKINKEWCKVHEDWPADKPFPSIAEMAEELDFKPILGNEIYLSEEGLCEENMYSGHFWHLILLAKDAEGFKQIKQLSSAAWRRAWFRAILRTPTYPSDLFKFVQGGHLIASTACLGGYTAWCWKQIQLGGYEELMPWETPEEVQNQSNTEFYLAKLDNHLAAMTELFGEGNFFIELQPNEGAYGKEQNDYNKFMIERYWGIYPFIFSTDAHFLNKDEREIHKAFLNSKSSSDREVDSFYRYAYIMSQQEVRDLMPYVTDEMFMEMVNNTKKIADMCQFYELEQPKVIARVEYEHMDEYEEDLAFFEELDRESHPFLSHYLFGEDSEADKYLGRLIAHGFVQKYKDEWDIDTYFNRLEEELWTIKTISDNINQPMSDYFITMSKMVDLMWDAGSLVGPSRGSAGAMLLNYLIDITQMDPIALDLPFVWRFMHPSRPDYPDIDVDSESDKRALVFNKVKEYFNGIGGDVVNVCTFGTEGTKSALKTAGRGLNIDEDVINYLTSMIPNERGFDWSLSDCYNGNGEDRAPIKAFKEEIDKHKGLWALANNIEGLVTRLGVHASGVICVNGDFIEHGSYMKTTKEQLVTAFDLHDQEECGVLKYDMLTVSALDRIHQCLNYMLDDGTIEWQGSLKATYNKYLHPSVLDYESEEMWKRASDGDINSLFQFDTAVGGQSIKKIQPRSLKQLAIANSIMRLMAEGEQPIDIYVKQKLAPQIWYDDMRASGLTNEEIKVVEKYLKEKDGVADSQEVVMQLSMDPQISGFSMKDANRLRKIIAKKNFKDIEAMYDFYLESGKALGTSTALLNYVWFKQFKLSFGYSFSTIHTTGYSLIAVQEMNLAYHYPTIYWNCACLSVDSSAVNAQDFYNLIEEDIVSIDDVEGKKTQNKMDYAKLASALDKFKNVCRIDTPDINESRLGFTPDVKNNTILYGLKGITRVTEPVINEIMMNRPFSSLQDFLTRTNSRVATKDKVINLIKCGAFDRVEGKDRAEILKEFIWERCEPKKKLTMQNANMLIDLGLLPNEFEYQSDVYKLTKELRRHKDSQKLWYRADQIDIPYNKVDQWRQIVKDSKIVGEELVIDGEPGKFLDLKKWDGFYNIQMEKIKNYIKANHDTLLDKLNNRLFSDEWQKYCDGDRLQWELDSLNFYFSGHPLLTAIPEMDVEVHRVDEVVEGASDGFFLIKGKQIPKMRLYTLAGTVIDRDKVKGLVTMQTPDGVVNIKCYKDLYAIYAQTISEVDENGNKEVEEESFFEKGVHLLVTGIQRGSTFIPKTYKNTGRKSIMRIIIDEEGHFFELEEKEG